MGKAPTRSRRGAESSRTDLRALSVSVAGNRLTLLPDGPERIDALIALIDRAQTSLRLQYYIYMPDSTGTRVKSALARAARRGVRVSLLLDGFGSSTTPEGFFGELREAGCYVCRFNPSFGRRYLLRNHQKLALADGETKQARVMIGGFNIADDYFGTTADGAWRDLGLIIEGEAAARLTPYFDRLMEWARGPTSKRRALRELINRYSETRGPLQWQLGAFSAKLSPWGVSTCRDLVHGSDVEMIAAYFAPTWGLLRRIGRAGKRGRARVITAAKSDNNATIAAARFTYGRLLKRGVEIFEYTATKLHTKLLVLDDVVHIGSSNFDIRSLYLNMELMLRIQDGKFAQLMRTYFEGELAHCQPITPELHKKRASFVNRIRWAISFFLVTSLDYGVTRRLNFELTGE